MRCPKCGYISFDHLEVCVKCKKNIKAVSDTLRGTVYQVKSPVFLRLQSGEDDDSVGDIPVAQTGIEEEYIDEDLEILIEEPQDEEIAFRGDAPDGPKPEKDEDAADEQEDREIEVDFSQFEETRDEDLSLDDGESADDSKEEKSFSLEMPETLADISDLAPPSRTAEPKKEPSPVAPRESSSDSDLDGLDFNLALDDLDLSMPAGSSAETELSLDDLDFSETLAKEPPKAKEKTGADMDEELNFELDLGGLSIHKDQ